MALTSHGAGMTLSIAWSLKSMYMHMWSAGECDADVGAASADDSNGSSSKARFVADTVMRLSWCRHNAVM